ncbi:MAG: hypothetical protein II811_00310 [Spirochaetaceae bacterium]|nr:hypothetical protein [Spirochaetaceae bacterium]
MKSVDFSLLDSRIDSAAAELFSLGFTDSRDLPPQIRSVYNKLSARLLEYFDVVQRPYLERVLGADKADDFNLALCKVIKKCLATYRTDAKTADGEPTSFSRYFSVQLKFAVQRYVFSEHKKSAAQKIDFDSPAIEQCETQSEPKPEWNEAQIFRLVKCADLVFSREQERVKPYRSAILTFCLLKEICKAHPAFDKKAIVALLSAHSFFDRDVCSAFFTEQKLTLEKVAEHFGKIRNDASRTKRILFTRIQSALSDSD